MARTVKKISDEEAKVILEKYDSVQGFTGGLSKREIFLLGRWNLSCLYDLSPDLAWYYMEEVDWFWN